MRLGHDPGGVDGIAGPKTKVAIQAFQRRQRLTPDGILTSDLVDTLQTAR
jgi:peptidoglycan hydrolase-like protein with peptidoglycan-binding domain